MRQIHDGIFVSRRCIADFQFVVISESITHAHGKIARITFLSVMAQIVKRETSTILHVEGPGIPDNFVEAFVATVKMIRFVIGSQLVFNAIQRESALCDSIAVTTNGRAKKRSSLEVSIDIVEAEHNVVELSVA